MARPERFELPTNWFEASYSIQLSMLFLDGVYLTRDKGDGLTQMFRRINAPTKADLEVLLHRISIRLARFLVKQGILELDIEHSYLNLDHLEERPLRQVHGHSITYRIVVGPQQGRKVFNCKHSCLRGGRPVQPARESRRISSACRCGYPGQSTQKLERICRHLTAYPCTISFAGLVSGTERLTNNITDDAPTGLAGWHSDSQW